MPPCRSQAGSRSVQPRARLLRGRRAATGHHSRRSGGRRRRPSPSLPLVTCYPSLSAGVPGHRWACQPPDSGERSLPARPRGPRTAKGRGGVAVLVPFPRRKIRGSGSPEQPDTATDLPQSARPPQFPPRRGRRRAGREIAGKVTSGLPRFRPGLKEPFPCEETRRLLGVRGLERERRKRWRWSPTLSPRTPPTGD